MLCGLSVFFGSSKELTLPWTRARPVRTAAQPITSSVRPELREYPSGKEIPHDRYIRVVSELDSPVERLYIASKDGAYLAAALRRPKREGKLPLLIYFHGAPGGRGMDALVNWSLGKTGSPVWERFIEEGYVVVIADYRNGPVIEGAASRGDDGVAIVDYLRTLSYVDPQRVYAYGVSLGGDVVLHIATKTKLTKAVIGAPGPMSFMGVILPPRVPGAGLLDSWKNPKFDVELTKKNIEAIQCPVLIIVGTADPLINIARPLYQMMANVGKTVRLDIYEKGYHDFCIGPQGYPGAHQPLLTSTLAALDRTIEFLSKE